MTVPASQAVLDLSADRLAGLGTFGARAEKVKVSQLVVALVRLEASCARARAAQKLAGEIEGLGSEFLASLSETEAHVNAMREVIAGEIDRRFAERG
jgi:hypothetical protein